MGTSVLQLQGADFCQQPMSLGKESEPKRILAQWCLKQRASHTALGFCATQLRSWVLLWAMTLVIICASGNKELREWPTPTPLDSAGAMATPIFDAGGNSHHYRSWRFDWCLFSVLLFYLVLFCCLLLLVFIKKEGTEKQYDMVECETGPDSRPVSALLLSINSHSQVDSLGHRLITSTQ